MLLNGAPSTLTCTVGIGQSTCSDTADTVDFAALDDINLRSLAITSPSSTPDCFVTAKLADASGNPYASVVSWGGGGAADSFAPADGDFCGPGNDLDDITECLGANANDPVNAQAASFIAPVGGTLSGLGVRQSVAPAAAESVTYTVHNVTADRDVGLTATLNGATGDVKQIATTCTHDCQLAKGDLVTVRFNGPNDNFANRNIAVTIDGVGQINTSRRNAAILSSGSGFGNYNSPWVDTTNAARAERDTVVQHLAVQVPQPAVRPVYGVGVPGECGPAAHLRANGPDVHGRYRANDLRRRHQQHDAAGGRLVHGGDRHHREHRRAAGLRLRAHRHPDADPDAGVDPDADGHADGHADRYANAYPDRYADGYPTNTPTDTADATRRPTPRPTPRPTRRPTPQPTPRPARRRHADRHADADPDRYSNADPDRHADRDADHTTTPTDTADPDPDRHADADRRTPTQTPTQTPTGTRRRQPTRHADANQTRPTQTPTNTADADADQHGRRRRRPTRPRRRRPTRPRATSRPRPIRRRARRLRRRRIPRPIRRRARRRLAHSHGKQHPGRPHQHADTDADEYADVHQSDQL